MKKKLIQKLAAVLKPLLPALFTGGMILSFAAAPMLAPIPKRLIWTLPAMAASTEPPAATTAPETQETEPDTTALLEAPQREYRDGSYSGVGIGFGGEIRLAVTVEQGRITAIEILSASGETESFLIRAKTVIDGILSAQTWEVDAVSGATYSSEGIKAAVKNALTGEAPPRANRETHTVSDNPQPITEISFDPPQNGYRDGIYTGSAHGFGGNITVQVTITGGSITSITVLSAAGETDAFFRQAKAVIPAILQAQSPKVDAVSGATYSSNGIKEAVNNALASAKASSQNPEPTEPEPTEPETTEPETTEPEPTESEPTEPEPTNPAELPITEEFTETYVGTATVAANEEESFWDYDITLTVTVSVKRTTVETDGQRKTVTERTVTEVSVFADTDAVNLAFLHQAFNQLKPQLMDCGEIDAVSGATCSSNGIRDAWEQAMQEVVLGETVEIVDSTPTEPEPTGSEPTEPEPTEPEPTEPEPTEPEPTEPEPTEPETTEPEPTSPAELPITEEFTETYVGTATVAANEEESFWDYDITLTVTVSVKRTTVETDGQRKTVTERTVTEVSVFADTDAVNLAFLHQAFNQLKPQLMDCGEIDAVSGATCSSNGIRDAWEQAMQEVILGETVEIVDSTP